MMNDLGLYFVWVHFAVPKRGHLESVKKLFEAIFEEKPEEKSEEKSEY